MLVENDDTEHHWPTSFVTPLHGTACTACKNLLVQHAILASAQRNQLSLLLHQVQVSSAAQLEMFASYFSLNSR